MGGRGRSVNSRPACSTKSYRTSRVTPRNRVSGKKNGWVIRGKKPSLVTQVIGFFQAAKVEAMLCASEAFSRRVSKDMLLLM